VTHFHERELDAAKSTLEAVEVKAPSGVALALTEVAESLSRTAQELTDMRAGEWMTAEQAARHLGCESVKAFEKIASREGIPKHYLSARAPATTAPSSTAGSWGAGKEESVDKTLPSEPTTHPTFTKG
jgi:hypothetical protein